VPDHDVHTEHDPREPVLSDESTVDEPAVGRAQVGDEAVADAETEPVTDESSADGTAVTYESAAHNGSDEWQDGRAGGSLSDETDTEDDTVGPADPFGSHTPTTTDDDQAADDPTAADESDDQTFGTRYRTDDTPVAVTTDDTPAHDDAVEAATYGDHAADDEAFRDRAADDTAFDTVANSDDDPVVDDTAVDNDTVVDDTASDEDTDEAAVQSDTAVVDEASDEPDDEVVAVPVEQAQPVPGEKPETVDQALKPGAVVTEPLGRLWGDADVDGIRARWRELQLKFIDDPQSVAGEAEALVAEAVDGVTSALQARKDQLSDWHGAGGDDTERLRAAVRRYRDFLDQLLGL
jgi:hypothetical protein